LACGQLNFSMFESLVNVNNNPLVSITILLKNGGKLFRDSLDMIFQQDVDFPFEVIVVDSGSTDGSLEVCRRYPVRLFEIPPEEFSFGPTRDFAFEQTQGKYIVTLSQDVVPSTKSWLKNVVTPLIADKADVVAGGTVLPEDREVFFWEKEECFYFTCEGRAFIQKYGNVGLSCTNMAIKKSVWEKTKFSPAKMSEDRAIQRKLYTQGFRITTAEKAEAFHGHTYTLQSLIKRCENEGMGWRAVGVKYTLKQLFGDITKRWMYGKLVRGIRRGEVRNMAEFLFIFIRPVFLYKGNLLNNDFKK